MQLLPILPFLAVLALIPACASGPAWPDVPSLPIADEKKVRDARQALRELRESPDDEDRIIWYGRRLAYLGEYQSAIDIYTRGLSIHPTSAKLLRHRGHRYITLRQLPSAAADFAAATRLIDGRPDEIEPDGIPNARNTPTSTLHTNIFYHRGLTQYCRGDFDAARASYLRCLDAAKNRDMECAARYWLYLSTWRSGDDALAASVLHPVAADWDIIENHAYHRLLLLFRGDLPREQLTPKGSDAVKNATLAYGLARHLLMSGDQAAGNTALRALADQKSAAFGCIAAEFDLAAPARKRR